MTGLLVADGLIKRIDGDRQVKTFVRYRVDLDTRRAKVCRWYGVVVITLPARSTGALPFTLSCRPPVCPRFRSPARCRCPTASCPPRPRSVPRTLRTQVDRDLTARLDRLGHGRGDRDRLAGLDVVASSVGRIERHHRRMDRVDRRRVSDLGRERDAVAGRVRELGAYAGRQVKRGAHVPVPVTLTVKLVAVPETGLTSIIEASPTPVTVRSSDITVAASIGSLKVRVNVTSPSVSVPDG